MRSLFGMLLCLMVPALVVSAKEYRGPIEDQRVWKSLDAFAPQFAKQYGLELLGTGLGSMMDTPRVKWCMSLVDHRPTTQEQMRPQLIQMADSLWKKVSTDPVFAAVLRPGEKIRPELVGVKIAFWDSDVNRPLFPYLAQVRVTGEKITYFYADPKTQALQEPIVETIEEAKAKSQTRQV